LSQAENEALEAEHARVKQGFPLDEAGVNRLFDGFERGGDGGVRGIEGGGGIMDDVSDITELYNSAPESEDSRMERYN
jgi:hypothetical protein